MRITTDKAVNGLKNYLNQEVSKVQDPLKKFGFLFAVNSMDTRKTVEFAQRMGLWGLFDSEGYIDTTDVRNGLKSAFTGVNEVCLLGLRFTVQDVDSLIQSIEQ